MTVFIPKELFVNLKHRAKVEAILQTCDDSDLYIVGAKKKTLSDAIPEIRVLGEPDVADFLETVRYGG